MITYVDEREQMSESATAWPPRHLLQTTSDGRAPDVGNAGTSTRHEDWVWVSDPADDGCGTAVADRLSPTYRLDSFVRSCLYARLLGG